MKNIVYPFLDQWSPRSAYQDIELEVPIVPEMTVDITEGSYCIVYKESKPNDMGSSIKDNIMKLTAMWHDYSMRQYTG
jgi:hypothetical protein